MDYLQIETRGAEYARAARRRSTTCYNKAGQDPQDRFTRTSVRTLTHAPKDQYTLHVKAAQEGASNVTVMAVDSVRVSE